MRRCLLPWAVCGVWVGSLQACGSDLFHDTSWPTACELDPATPSCPSSAASGGSEAGGLDALRETAISEAVDARDSPIGRENSVGDALDAEAADAGADAADSAAGDGADSPLPG